MRISFLVFLSMFIMSCRGGGSTATNAEAGLAELTGFESVAVQGTNAKFNTKRNSSGAISEEGITRNGVKDGAWMTYHSENNAIKSLTSYINGKKCGVEMEFSKRGQMEKRAGYLNDQLHGLQGDYSFGRPVKEYNYNNGVLDGPFAEYDSKGKLQKRGSFLNGKQHGKLEFFDGNDNLVMEYQYDNGERIGGGIVEKKKTEPEVE